MPAWTPSARAVLVAASAAQAAVSFVTLGLPSIGPQLREAYGLSLAGLGAVLTASLLGAGLALIPAGVIVDRLGLRAAIVGGTAVAAGALVAAAFTTSNELLLVTLFVSGVGSAVVPVAGAGTLLRIYPARRRGTALGVRQTAVPAGGLVAAAVLPLLEAIGGVRLALLVGAGVVGAAGLAFAVVAGAEAAPRLRSPRALRSILAVPGVPRLLLVGALYAVVLQSLLTYTVPAARAAGLSALSASAAYLAVTMTAIVARIVWGGTADRGGGTRRVRTLVETGVVAALGAVLFALALHAGVVAVVAAAVVFGFGALGWNAILYVSAGERAPAGLAGRSFALAATVVFVFSALCTPLLGALAAHVGWDTFWTTTAVLAAAGAAISARLPRTVPG
jgi:MFS family permease